MAWVELNDFEAGWTTLEEAQEMIRILVSMGYEENQDVFILGCHDKTNVGMWDNDLEGASHFAITLIGEFILEPGEPDDEDLEREEPTPKGWRWRMLA